MEAAKTLFGMYNINVKQSLTCLLSHFSFLFFIVKDLTVCMSSAKTLIYLIKVVQVCGLFGVGAGTIGKPLGTFDMNFLDFA